MKIAIISHLKFPIAEPFAGGLEMHTHLLAKHLIRRGHDVTLFAAEGSDPELGLIRVASPTGAPTAAREIEATALTEHHAYDALLSQVAGGGFDVVHVNALHYLPLTNASRVPAPMLVTLHTPPFPELETAIAERTRSDVRFIAVSETVARMWRHVAQADVVHNGIDLAQFRPRLGASAARSAIWTGRVVPEKGLHLAIAAARQAAYSLRIAGPIADRDYWQSSVAPSLHAGATYLGHLDHHSLAQEVAAANVALVTPRWEEPYGLVVAEALACGTPVAGFARGALPALLDEQTGRLVGPDDVDALAEAMPLAAALSRGACRERAISQCDAAGMVTRYEELYRQMIGGASAFPATLTRGVEAK